MSKINFLNQNIFFTTRQYAMALKIPIATASRQLQILKKEKSIQIISRGVWGQTQHPFFSPYGAVPYLLGNEQGYVSFLTALHRHDVISQIPQVIQIATTGHGRKLSSSIGEFEFFHIQPNLMQKGIETHSNKLMYNIASPEKALFDALYISSRKGRRFSRFPELNWKMINKKELYRIIDDSTPVVRKLVLTRLNLIISRRSIK